MAGQDEDEGTTPGLDALPSPLRALELFFEQYKRELETAGEPSKDAPPPQRRTRLPRDSNLSGTALARDEIAKNHLLEMRGEHHGVLEASVQHRIPQKSGVEPGQGRHALLSVVPPTRAVLGVMHHGSDGVQDDSHR